ADTVYASRTGANVVDRIVNAGTSPSLTLTIGSGSAAEADGTLAGCSMNAPMGGWVVGTGPSAILYWADRVPGSIRKINIGGNAVTTVSGPGNACTDGFAGAGGFAQPHNVVMGPDGNLYVNDQTSGLIRKVALPSRNLTTIGGGCNVYTPINGCGV